MSLRLGVGALPCAEAPLLARQFEIVEPGCGGAVFIRDQFHEQDAVDEVVRPGNAHACGREPEQSVDLCVLVKELALVLNTYGALVADYDDEKSQLRPRAYWLGDQWVEPSPYDIAGTPCDGVIRKGELFQLPDQVIDHYPQNEFLRNYDLVSYTGMPFKDSAGRIIGHLAILDSKPVPEESRFMALFKIFGNRAAAEMRRIRAEEELRDREQRLRRLIDGALDSIIDFDDQLMIHLANPSAKQLFGGSRSGGRPASMHDWFTEDSVRLIRDTPNGLGSTPENRQAWIGSRLQGVRANGDLFDVQATLSTGVHRDAAFYTLILRDVNALRQAEKQIRRLQQQADLLRDELAALQALGIPERID